MTWEVKTTAKVHKVSTNSSRIALEKVREKDKTELVHVKLLPPTFFDKLKKFVRWQ